MYFKKIPVFLFTVIIILLSGIDSFAQATTTSKQNRIIDSLLNLIKTDKADTNEVNHLIQLCEEYRKSGEHENGLKYCNKAISLASSIRIDNKTGWLKGISASYFQKGYIHESTYNFREALTNYFAALKMSNLIMDSSGSSAIYFRIGTLYSLQSNYSEALKNHLLSLEQRKKAGDKQGQAESYNAIGTVYFYLSDYSEALKNYLSALRLAEETNNKRCMAKAYNNIANIHQLQNNFSEALKNYFSSIKINKGLNEQSGTAICYLNVGKIYDTQGDYEEALKSYSTTLQIGKETKNKQLIATTYNNIGDIYVKQHKYPEAVENFTTAIKIFEESNDKYSLAASLINISEVQLSLHKLTEANNLVNESLKISREIGSKEFIMNGYKQLTIIDSLQKNWKAAYEHYSLYTIYKDSIDNEMTRKKTMQSTLTYEFEKKASAEKAEQEKKDAVTAANKKKQQLILLLVCCVLILVFLFAGLILRSLRITRKQKIIIEEKNKDIIDSINYAKRIQDALLKNEAYIGENLPKYFIFYKPKDIVSGDFYWSIEKQGYWYLAVADCTGHGVPGGFMSMLGIAFLNEITANAQLLSPSEILDQLRDKIVKELGQNEKVNQTKDGMDISLVRFHLQTKELQWAGANNSLYFIQNDELKEIKPDKQPIGYHPDMQPFTNHILQPEGGAMFYLLTDGYADQFGGTKGKKFMQKNLKGLLQSIHSQSVYEQKEIVARTFDLWKKDLSQVDDVCIVGVKII